MNNKIVIPNELMLGEVSAMLSEGREVIILTKGVSMLPFIRGGIDSVLLVAKDSPVPGDIALCEIRPGHYVLHRIVAIDEKVVLLHGDGNLRGTESCTPAAIKGVVKSILRPDGKQRYPSAPRALRAWKLWKALPLLCRRVILKIYRIIYYRKQI